MAGVTERSTDVPRWPRPSGSSSPRTSRSVRWSGRPRGGRGGGRSTRASTTSRRGWRGPASRPPKPGWPTFFAAGEELWDQRKRLRLLDRRRPDDAVVGGCGLHGRLDEHGLEIGYWVHVDRIGQGLATERRAGAHRRGVRHPWDRTGADPVRGRATPAAPGCRRSSATRFEGVEVPDDGPCEGRPTQVWLVDRADWIARRQDGRLVAFVGWTIARSGCSTAASAASPSPGR